MFEELIEVLVQYFSKPPYVRDFTKAKEIYTHSVGSVVEEHPYFDTWISGFFEWFLIDYPMTNVGVPPVFLYQRMFWEKLDRMELEFLRELEKCPLEFLEIQAVSENTLKGTEVFSKTATTFHTHQNPSVFHKGDFVITRILRAPRRSQSFGVVWQFSNEIAAIVQPKLEKIANSNDQKLFLFELIRKKTQSEIYSHVPLQQIFGWKSEQRIHLDEQGDQS